LYKESSVVEEIVDEDDELWLMKKKSEMVKKKEALKKLDLEKKREKVKKSKEDRR
jgi:hypothetical protein